MKAVEPISIHLKPAGVGLLWIRIDGVRLTLSEARLFAYRDGFRAAGLEGALHEMAAYYRAEGVYRFFGYLNHWSYWR